jgi:hypothetical protein
VPPALLPGPHLAATLASHALDGRLHAARTRRLQAVVDRLPPPRCARHPPPPLRPQPPCRMALTNQNPPPPLLSAFYFLLASEVSLPCHYCRAQPPMLHRISALTKCQSRSALSPRYSLATPHPQRTHVLNRFQLFPFSG